MVQLTAPPETLQDRQVYDYLYQLQEYLRLALEQTKQESGETTARSARAASAEMVEQVRYLKALIIKTADEVESRTAVDLSALRALIDSLGDVIEGDGGLRLQLLALQGDYVARSQFGTYAEAVAQQLEATAAGLSQSVQYAAELRGDLDAVSADFAAWRVASEGYIRSGVVGYRADETPIIGIAIGQNLTVLQDSDGSDVTVTVDGAAYKVVEQKGFRAIYAADELSFWQDEKKVAYMSNNQLYITDVTALSGLRVGSWSVSDTVAHGLVIRWQS